MKGHWQILSSYQATVNYATDDLQIQLPFVSRKDDWGGILYWHQEQSTIIRMSKTNLRTKVNKKWHHASQCYLVFDLKIKSSMLENVFVVIRYHLVNSLQNSNNTNMTFWYLEYQYDSICPKIKYCPLSDIEWWVEDKSLSRKRTKYFNENNTFSLVQICIVKIFLTIKIY